MARGRRIALRALAAFAALLILGVVVLNSPIGHRFVVDQIAKVAPASGLRITVGRIEGSLYGEAVLHDVTLSDPKGPFMRVPRVELDWRPFNWFVRGLDVRRLVGRRGVLLRVPELLPGDPDAPILPDFDIRIDRLELDDFTVAKGVLGEARKVELLARADVRAGRVYLKADGRLGGTDRLHALVDAWPDGDRFDLALDYNAPRGGLLASLAGADSAFRARIVGEGTWTKWNGAAQALQDGKPLAAFRLTNRAGQYALLGQTWPDRVLTGLTRRALGGTVSLSAQGTLEDSVVDGKLAMKSAGLYLTGKGAVDLADNAFDAFEVRTVLRNPKLFGEGLTLKGAGAVATLDGPFRDLTAVHRLRVAELDAGTKLFDLRHAATLTYQDGRLTLPLAATVGRIETGTGALDPHLRGGRFTGTVVLDKSAIHSDDLSAIFPGLAARLVLRGNTAKGGYALAGPVAARGFPLENLGTVDADAKIVFRIGAKQPWNLRANLAGRMPRVTNATLTAIAGSNIRFKGGVSLGGGQPVVFTGASLSATKLALTLGGRVVDGRTTLAGTGRHVDYGPFTVEAAIAADGPRAQLVFARPWPPGDLSDVRVALAPIPDGFRIDTRGGSMLGPFDGTIDLYAVPGGPTRLSIRRMDVSQTLVTGDLALGSAGVTGELALAGGGAEGTIRLAPRGQGQGFDVALRARDATFSGPPPVMVRKADIDLHGVLVKGGLEARGSVYAQGISRGQLFIGQLAARADVSGGQGTVTASLAGRRGSNFALQLLAGVAPERVTLLARGNYAGQAIAMPRRAVFSKEADGWSLAPAQFSFGTGRIVAEGRFGGSEPVSGKLQLAEMPLSLIDVVVPDVGLGGKASGIVEFRRSRGDAPPTGTARLSVRGLSRSGLVITSRPVDLYLVADLSGGRFETRAVIEDQGKRLGRLQGRITGLPRAGGLYQRLSAGNLFAQLRYGGPADALWRLAAIEAFDLTGPIDVAADVTGTLAAPRVRGSLSSDAMRMRSALTGTDVKDISVRGSFAGSVLRLTRFSGKAKDGTVSGSGIVDLEGLGPKGPTIDLRLSASNAQILNRRDMAATVTGPLRIVSDGNGGTIAGRLKVDRANWRLGNAADVRELPDIPTREINTPPDVAPRRERGKPWRYLIDARSSSRLFVRGMGLDSEWGANIRLRGTTSDPRIGGTAQVLRGGYEFAGTRFELTRGRIAFDESVPIDPRLDIAAETDLDNLEVRVTVKGSAAQPEIAFSSTPALPEEEILARLLFGGSIQDLSATDALQLGSALASLRGGGGLDPINRLRTAIGLDRLRIVSADPALGRETSVALGKNIGRKVYVEIVTDGKGYSATEVEYRITRWLSLLGAVSTIGRESIKAEISKDY